MIKTARTVGQFLTRLNIILLMHETLQSVALLGVQGCFPLYQPSFIHPNFFKLIYVMLQKDPLKLETGGYVDLKTLKRE